MLFEVHRHQLVGGGQSVTAHLVFALFLVFSLLFLALSHLSIQWALFDACSFSLPLFRCVSAMSMTNALNTRRHLFSLPSIVCVCWLPEPSQDCQFLSLLAAVLRLNVTIPRRMNSAHSGSGDGDGVWVEEKEEELPRRFTDTERQWSTIIKAV